MRADLLVVKLNTIISDISPVNNAFPGPQDGISFFFFLFASLCSISSSPSVLGSCISQCLSLEDNREVT